MNAAEALRQKLDWGSIAPLRLRTRMVAEGLYGGAHRSSRKGAGVEFGGHRNYVPGDDLRWLDRHALMRHSRLMIREFETETERHLHLIVDASPSMAYRGANAPGAKLAFAALLSASLAYVASRERDPVGVSFIGGTASRLPPRSGSEAFERLIHQLETMEPRAPEDVDEAWSKAAASIGRDAPRGSIVVVLSDLLGVSEHAREEVARIAAHSRKIVALQILDPEEAEFPFDGPLRLRDPETDRIIETDGARARRGYLEALEALTSSWRNALIPRGGQLVRAVTTEDPTLTLRTILEVIAGTKGRELRR